MMAFNPAISPLKLLNASPINGGDVINPVPNLVPGLSLWGYDSIYDTISTVSMIGYFTNVIFQGVRLGDIIFVYDRINGASSVNYVSSFSGNNASITNISVLPIQDSWVDGTGQQVVTGTGEAVVID